MKNYSRVRLITDAYKNEGVSDRAVGYIIEVFNDGVYEVEFSDSDGTTAALLTLRESDLEFAEFGMEPIRSVGETKHVCNFIGGGVIL